MTQQEFISGYVERSGVSVELLMARRVALPCACGEDGCEGWAMVPNDPDSVETHNALYAPERETI